MGDSNKDLEALAKSCLDDFYELLGVSFDADEATIKKAYRKASIRYHPDKNPDNEDAADRFIHLGWARDILLDPKLKGEYDRARTRRREKTLQDELLDGRRRKMKEDLERREHEARSFAAGWKRKRAEELTEAEKRELELERLAEDGKRRRKEMQERREQQRKADDEQSHAASEKSQASHELNRTLKISYRKEGDAASWDKERISQLFTKYGAVDMVLPGKEKKTRPSVEKHRKIHITAYVVYKRLDHAHAAVLHAKEDFPALESIAWMNGAPNLTANATAGSGAPSLEEITNIRLTEAGIKQQAEKARKEAERRVEEERRLEEKRKKQQPPDNPSTPLTTPMKAFGASFALGNTPKFSFTPPASLLTASTKQAERKKREQEILDHEAMEEA